MMEHEDKNLLRDLLREIRVKASMALRCANADASGNAVPPAAIGTVQNGVILDGRVYEAVPFQNACQGCALFKRCAGGRAYLCDSMDKMVGHNCMFRETKENNGKTKETKEKDGQD